MNSAQVVFIGILGSLFVLSFWRELIALGIVLLLAVALIGVLTVVAAGQTMMGG